MRMRTSSRSANMGWKCRRRRRNKGRATGKKQRRRTIVVLLLARAGRGENYGKKRSRCVSRHDVLPPTTMIIMCLECCLPLAVSVFGSQVVVGGGHNFLSVSGGLVSVCVELRALAPFPFPVTDEDSMTDVEPTAFIVFIVIFIQKGNHARHVDPPLDLLPLFERWLVGLCSGLCNCSSAAANTRWSGCLC